MKWDDDIEFKLCCDVCGSEVTKLNGANKPLSDEVLFICDICYRTQIGNILMYEKNYSSAEENLAKALAQLGNLILERIGG